MVRNNQLVFAQKLVGNSHALVQQSTWILAQIENQSLQIAGLIEAVERVLHFFFGGLIKPGDVHVTNSRMNQKVQIHAVARNLVADNREFERLVVAFTEDGDVDGRTLRSF